MSEPINLYDLERGELASLIMGWGEPRYRADQNMGMAVQT